MQKFILIAWLLLCKFTQAQQLASNCNFKLRGIVKDAHNNASLPYATIFIKGTQIATVSDSVGHFYFENLCAGNYVLVSSHLDCENVELAVNLSKNTAITILQEHHSKELHQLVIAAQRTASQQSLNMSSLGIREMEASQGKALGEMLKSISGVNSLQTGNSISKPIIHGLHSNRIIIMNNSVRQEGQQWGSEHGPEIDPFVADKISVIKGAAGVRYGPDAIAGVVLIEPNALRDSTGYDASINIVGASNGKQGTISGILNGNIKQFNGLSFRIQGTLKQAGNSKAPDYFLKNTGFTEKNFSLAAAYQKNNFGTSIFYSKFNTKLGILAAAHIGNLSDLERAFNSNVPLDSAGFTYKIQRPYQSIVHDLIKWNSYINLNRAGKIIYTLSRQSDNRSEYDKHGPRNDSLAALNKPELDFIIHTLIHEILYELQHHKKYNIVVGYSNMHQANSYNGRYFIPNFNNKGWGTFLIENYKHKNFFAEAGIRYDERKLRVFQEKNGFIRQPLFSYKKLSGLIGAGFLFKNHELKLNFGTGWRAPAVNELFANGVHHGAAAVEIGDENLLPESNFNTSFWWGIKTMQKLSGEIEIYQNTIQHFIYLIPVQPATQTIRGAFPTFKYKQVNALLRGIDIQLKYPLSNYFNVIVKGSYLYALNTDNKSRLTQMPQNIVEPSLIWEPKITNQKWSNLYLKLSYLMVAKAIKVSNDEDYLAPPNAYQLLNIDAGINYVIKKQKLNFGISITNVLNSKYRSYLNRYRYFADDLGTNVSMHLKIPINFKTTTYEKK